MSKLSSIPTDSAIKSEPYPQWPALVAILLLALVVRLSVFHAVYRTDPQRILTPDSPTYEKPALALLAQGRLDAAPVESGALDTPAPELVRTPGYPALIAAVYAAFGPNREALIGVQIVLSVGAIALAWGLARRVAGARAALLAALLLALDPVSFLYSQLLLSETLFTVLMILALLAGGRLLAAIERPAEGGGCIGRWAFLLGLALAAATLTRPVTVYLIWPLALGLAWILVRRRLGWRRVAAALACLLLPWAALVGGWQARNYVRAGVTDLSTIKTVNLLVYRAAGVVAMRDRIPLEEAQRRVQGALPEMAGRPVAEQLRVQREEAGRILRAHPVLVARMQAAGMVKILFGLGTRTMRRHLGLSAASDPAGDLRRLPPVEYLKTWPLGRPGEFLLFFYEACLLGAVYVGLALSVIGGWRQEKGAWAGRACHVFLWLIVGYLVIVSAGPEAYSRFRMPLMPILALYAAIGWSWLVGRVTERLRPTSHRRPDKPASPLRS